MDIIVISYGNMQIPFTQNFKMQKSAQDKAHGEIKSKRTNKTHIRRKNNLIIIGKSSCHDFQMVTTLHIQ